MEDGTGHRPDTRDRYSHRMRGRLGALENPSSSEVREVSKRVRPTVLELWITKSALSERRWVERMTTWRPSAGNVLGCSTSGNTGMEENASGRRSIEGIVVAVSM